MAKKRKPTRLMARRDIAVELGQPDHRVKRLLLVLDIKPEYYVCGGSVKLFHPRAAKLVAAKIAEIEQDKSLRRIGELTGLAKHRLRYLMRTAGITLPICPESVAQAVLAEHVKQGGGVPGVAQLSA